MLTFGVAGVLITIVVVLAPLGLFVLGRATPRDAGGPPAPEEAPATGLGQWPINHARFGQVAAGKHPRSGSMIPEPDLNERFCIS
jgi:hypothetical protein